MAKKPSTYPPARTSPAAVLWDEALPAGRPSALLDKPSDQLDLPMPAPAPQTPAALNP